MNQARLIFIRLNGIALVWEFWQDDRVIVPPFKGWTLFLCRAMGLMQ